MKKIIAVVFLVVAASSSVKAAPLDKTRIMKEANWTMHLDYDLFRQTTLGKEIMGELRARGFDQKLDNFAKVFSFHPINDIHNVTIFGQDKDPQKAAVIVQGTCNPATLTALVAMNADYEKSEYETYTIHSWIDEKQGTKQPRQYGCFYNDGTLLLSMGRDTLTQCLDVLNGKHANAVSNAMFNLFSEQNSSGIIASVYAEKAGQATDGIEQAAILRQTDQMAIVLGEQDSSAYLDILLQAKTTEDANKIKQLTQGIMAMASLSAGDKVPQLNALINAVEITCVKDTVRLQFKWDSKDLLTQLKAMEQLKKEQKTQQPKTSPAEPNSQL